MKGGKEKGKECGNREEAQRLGYGSVATRFTTPKIFVVVYQWVLLLFFVCFSIVYIEYSYTWLV